MLSAKNILDKTRLGSLASYWSGYGENESHLNYEILDTVFNLVKENNGEEASACFTNVVADLYFKSKDLSASTFITTVCRLDHTGWKYDPAVGSADSAANYAEMLDDEMKTTGGSVGSSVGIMMMMMGSGAGKNDRVRRGIGQHFLVSHAEMLTKDNLQSLRQDVKGLHCYSQVEALKV